VILAGYLGLVLVLGVSTALLVVVAGRASDRVRLLLRCLRWGFATGAVTGAVFGASLPLIGPVRGDPGPPFGLMLGAGVYGAVLGAVVALIPTLIGAVFITDLLRARHPSPTSEESMYGDLTSAFAVVVGVLDLIVVVSLVVARPDLSAAAIALPLLVAGNASVVLMLWRARRSISRLWLAVARSSF
jgi:hypothetical protein